MTTVGRRRGEPVDKSYAPDQYRNRYSYPTGAAKPKVNLPGEILEEA